MVPDPEDILPEDMLPEDMLPEELLPEELDELDELDAAGAELPDELPPVIAVALPVPFCAIAICSNMAWVLLAVALMEKVIPFPQSPDCLQ